jgi:hypothetical protein
VPRDMAQWKGETTSDTLMLNLDSYHYAADLLGGFVQEVQHGPLHKPTPSLPPPVTTMCARLACMRRTDRRFLMRQVPFVIWGEGLACGTQQALPASHRDMFTTLMPLVGVAGPYINTGRNSAQHAARHTPGCATRHVFHRGGP